MSLYDKLEENLYAYEKQHDYHPSTIPRIIRLLCNLLDAKFESLEHQRHTGMKENHIKNYGSQKD